MDSDNPPPLFPLPPPPIRGAGRSVRINAVAEWLRFGWEIFVFNPGVWLAISIIWLCSSLIILIPVLGFLAEVILFPVFAGGVAIGCHKIVEEKPLSVGDLFIGFKVHTGNLVLLGVLIVAGLLLMLVVAALVGGLSVLISFALGSLPEGLPFTQSIGTVLSAVMLFSLSLIVLSIPLGMAVLFAPILIMFHGMGPVPAMQASFATCARSLPAFCFLAMLAGLMILGCMLTAMVGMLVVLPVLSGAIYAAYRDTFVGNVGA